jgi:hypothetical protein
MVRTCIEANPNKHGEKTENDKKACVFSEKPHKNSNLLRNSAKKSKKLLFLLFIC